VKLVLAFAQPPLTRSNPLGFLALNPLTYLKKPELDSPEYFYAHEN
jgi:hypothetical protein